jgi:DNA phosphorothioation-dependent restriction protein DptG
MKKVTLIVIAVLILVFSLFAVSEENTDQKKEAIKKAALDYIEGWYEGNPERMERALHPDLNKKGVQVIPKTGKTVLNFASASMMVEYTRAGMGKNAEKKEKCEVIILDTFKDIASVKCISPDFIDYLLIAKCSGEWKIANVLWQMNR